MRRVLLGVGLVTLVLVGGCASAQDRHAEDLEESWQSLSPGERSHACEVWSQRSPEWVAQQVREALVSQGYRSGEPVSTSAVRAHFEEHCGPSWSPEGQDADPQQQWAFYLEQEWDSMDEPGREQVCNRMFLLDSPQAMASSLSDEVPEVVKDFGEPPKASTIYDHFEGAVLRARAQRVGQPSHRCPPRRRWRLVGPAACSSPVSGVAATSRSEAEALGEVERPPTLEANAASCAALRLLTRSGSGLVTSR